MVSAYRTGKIEEFNQAVGQYGEYLRKSLCSRASEVRQRVLLQPFCGLL